MKYGSFTNNLLTGFVGLLFWRHFGFCWIEMKRSQKKVEVTPPMPKGETEFEEKRIACEFQLLFTRISKLAWGQFSEPYEYAFRSGVITGKRLQAVSSEQSK